MEDDEQRKIDLKQHALSPVSRKYLLRIIIYVVLLTGLSYFMYSIYTRDPLPRKIKSPEGIEEIKGVKLINSL